MKKVALITGITGMVGSHLLDLLIKKTNWKIFGMCRWRSSSENIAHQIYLSNQKNPRLTFLTADLNDYSSIINILEESKPDYVFHLAAQSYPLVSFSEPNSTLSTNIIGTYNLLNGIRHLNLKSKIHICSSSEIFGRVEKKNLPIKENCSFHPASPYAISKVGTDLIGRFFYEAYKQKIFITRMFTHTGPRRGDVFAESSFAKQIAMIEEKKIEPNVKVGNLNSLRTFADVRDAVNAYYILLKNDYKAGEAYNIGGNYTCKIGDMLKFLISQSTVPNIKIIKDKKRIRLIDADLQIPDTSKFRLLTNWRPKISFEKTMLDLLNYWREKVKKRDYMDR